MLQSFSCCACFNRELETPVLVRFAVASGCTSSAAVFVVCPVGESTEQGKSQTSAISSGLLLSTESRGVCSYMQFMSSTDVMRWHMTYVQKL